MSAFDEIQTLLRERADLNARLSLIPYEGTPEIKDVKEQKYLYTRKRVGSRVTSTYVGAYSDELYQLLLRNTREARELKKQIRKLDKRLAELGYQEGELAPRVTQNLDFARANMKANIYDQADIDDIDKSIRLCLYTMKTQVFIDGNKRAAIIYANHYLIAHGQGFLVIPEAHVSEFKKLLVAYYESGDPERITDFLKLNCWKTFNKDVL